MGNQGLYERLENLMDAELLNRPDVVDHHGGYFLCSFFFHLDSFCSTCLGVNVAYMVP
jgi:hypothetical protein